MQAYREQYLRLLMDYFQAPDEALLVRAGDLGRALVTENVPPEDIAELHQQALLRLAQVYPKAPLEDCAPRTSAILLEVLMAYGLAFRELTERTREAERLRSQRMETIGTLAGGIAHDFNNLLGVILGFTEMTEALVTGDALDNLVQVHQATLRARDLVRQILTFARREAPVFSRLDLNDIIRETLEMLRRVLPANVVLRGPDVADPAWIMADPGQVQQVLMNLCSNASHAIGNRQGRITLTLEPYRVQGFRCCHGLELKPGSYYRIGVHDTGSGIAPEHLDRLFDPFFTTKAVGEGSGLGLSVIHGILGRHFGAVEVSSRIGQGTSFRVYFPALEPLAAPVPSLDREPVQGWVLLVADRSDCTALIQGMLEALGFIVMNSADPRQAVDLLRAEHKGFDLLICDLDLPGMDCDRLRAAALELCPGLPIIRCSDAPGAELPKPFTAEVLINTLERVLGRRCNLSTDD